MENRLQPGSGSPTPRLALFSLLASLFILLIGIYGLYRPSPTLSIQTPVSKSLLEAMAQDDPDDMEEQGDDIAVLRDEKAANPYALGPALALSRRLMQAGRYAEAERELRQVVRQWPRNLGARYLLGFALAESGQQANAVQEWRLLAQAGDSTWRSIAQGSIARVTHPKTAEIARMDTPIPDLRPIPPTIALQ